MFIPLRPRRNRRSDSIRALCQETRLAASDLILPLFLHEDGEDVEIASMPGCTRWSLPGLVREAGEAHALGVPAVVLFPKVPEEKKDPLARESWNPEGLIPQTVAALKAAHPTLTVITDVALDPYNSDGHDGIVAEDGSILNDETVEVLCEQALSQARAGADIVAPSDMMDGRVAALRAALDGEGYADVGILAYTAKYASA
ncbi:MAG: porphobilinogen synthase, partial [Verrucomicrobiales bacterium]|nr:porphobilinogen synthase [Verrucomicrobiales bacterium]